MIYISSHELHGALDFSSTTASLIVIGLRKLLSTAMPKASKASSPARLDQAPVDLAHYLETLVAPITELQGRLEALPSIAPQLHAHVATSEELSVKTQRINELEAAVATFDSVHMRTSEALRIEISNLTNRLEFEGKHVGSLKNDHDKSLEKIKLQHKQAHEKLELSHSSTIESLEKKYQDQLRDERNELDKVKREMEDVDVKNCGLREKLDLANEKLRLLEGNMAYLPEDNLYLDPHPLPKIHMSKHY